MARVNTSDTDAATAAYHGAIDLLNQMIKEGHREHSKGMKQLLKDIESGAGSIRCQVDFDRYEPLGFQFYLLKDGEEKLIFDAMPTRTTN